ncbi:hypothetical protein ACFYQA_17395 [Streptomyces sp. NPDC005774]|uniref:hypothetical protein n=1 Tax=Streptomyces sp. NPDC005774 TaxID=3364728 RepID=UPI0036C886FA
MTPNQATTLGILGGLAALLGLIAVIALALGLYTIVSTLIDHYDAWRTRRAHTRAQQADTTPEPPPSDLDVCQAINALPPAEH